MSDTTEQPADEQGPNQFILVIQDATDPGMINLAGAQRPAKHDMSSPSHIVGAFIQKHLAEIVAAAQADLSRGLGVTALADPQTVIGERTPLILVPGKDS